MNDAKFRALIEKAKVRRYKNVNGSWALGFSLDYNGKNHTFSIAASPNESWARCKKMLYMAAYRRLADICGYVGDITAFVK